MTLLAFYGLVVTVSLSGVMAPGPITALTLVRGRRDPLAGFWINIGHALAETPLIIALIVGLQPFLESESVYRGVSVAGGLVMLWMGQRLIRKGPEKSPEDEPDRAHRGPIYEGVAMTVFNPYWFLWWLTVGAGLITRGRAFGTPFVFSVMIALHLLCDLSWGTFLSFAAHRGGNVFQPHTWRRIEKGCGLALVLFAGFFLYEGVWKASG